MLIELDAVDRITTDAQGPPGERTFFIQGRKGTHLVTVLVEKQQVQLLAASVVEILARVGKETGEGPPEEDMGLEEPVLPEWRADRLSIGYQEERDLLMLEVEELVPEQDDEEEAEAGSQELEADEEGVAAPGETGEDLPEPGRIRFWATREQMLSLARHGAAVCAAGRPRCPYCDGPIDAEGHVCPQMNGHRTRGEG